MKRNTNNRRNGVNILSQTIKYKLGAIKTIPFLKFHHSRFSNQIRNLIRINRHIEFFKLNRRSHSLFQQGDQNFKVLYWVFDESAEHFTRMWILGREFLYMLPDDLIRSSIPDHSLNTTKRHERTWTLEKYYEIQDRFIEIETK